MPPYRLQIYLEPEVRDALRAVAFAEKTSLQALVTKWLVERLQATPQGAAPRAASCARDPETTPHDTAEVLRPPSHRLIAAPPAPPPVGAYRTSSPAVLLPSTA